MGLLGADNGVRRDAVARARQMLEEGHWFRADVVAAAILEATTGALRMPDDPV